MCKSLINFISNKNTIIVMLLWIVSMAHSQRSIRKSIENARNFPNAPICQQNQWESSGEIIEMCTLWFALNNSNGNDEKYMAHR